MIVTLIIFSNAGKKIYFLWYIIILWEIICKIPKESTINLDFLSNINHYLRLYVRMEVLRKLKLVWGVQLWYVETYKIICYNFLKKKIIWLIPPTCQDHMVPSWQIFSLWDIKHNKTTYLDILLFLIVTSLLGFCTQSTAYQRLHVN